MVETEWSPQAYQNFEAIVEFIANDSPHYAHLFAVDLFRTLDRIARFPNSGRMVPEAGNAAIREMILGSYRVMYRVGQKKVGLIPSWSPAPGSGRSQVSPA